ncbi:hypothetical protein ASPVEDRAFT_78417 [Aspergillus versicolor CBS 583.65]|uniref:DUF202 domain-containing protein n=1 Tax=Aspergillus versicolor CBS 583.65 TaxID=1036611 RepID=A0A1L9P578_ASPVE|nr:uncharacterized protein ASPVEDRAFT_78417 [Aspergillus versicolor CBS 583.65]OJI96658.1 hypothetical protein ASPVEDRAFT_78417 [Aspergillus versicolor CBS 583.65]
MPEAATPGTAATRPPYNPVINPVHAKPVLIEEHLEDSQHIFLTRPWFGALLFENAASDARDHCANERTFLSWLRLSMYLGIVSVALIISFHFKTEPSRIEKRMSLPMGIIFWVLSLVSLGNGLANYIRTVKKYSRKAALVQSGWKTQLTFMVVGGVILGSCIVLLVTDAHNY